MFSAGSDSQVGVHARSLGFPIKSDRPPQRLIVVPIESTQLKGSRSLFCAAGENQIFPVLHEFGSYASQSKYVALLTSRVRMISFFGRYASVTLTTHPTLDTSAISKAREQLD